ncbi:MAG: M56 family metallopeptidase [Oscillospiraceae bacterium]|nr:M56 family metallopeptidase [Oscillospiraceae bacterium]
MDGLFYWLLNMSILGTLTGAVILLLRTIKRIQRRWIVILWGIPLLRFWLPVSIGGKYSLMSLLSGLTTKTVVVYQSPGRETVYTAVNSVQAASSYFPITYRSNVLEDVFRWAALVWAVGAAALILALGILYVSTLSELRDAERLRDKVYVSPKVTAPAVYGILRPRIILPASAAASEDLELIVLHEGRHIRRGDNLWRMLAFFTAAIHWFNPAVWLFLKLFLSDAEIACDESVLSRLPADDRKRYAHALLNARTGKTVFASAFGGAKVRTRVERILSYRKMTLASVCAFALLAAAIAYFLLANGAP